MKDLQAVLFDLDGTLIDSEYFYFTNWAPILKREFGIALDFDGWLKHFAGHTLGSNVNTLNTVWGVDTTEEHMWEVTRYAYSADNMRGIRMMPGAVELLEFLKAEGIRIGLVTSSYMTTVDTVLGEHDLLSYFEFFVTREKVTNPKPNPEPYLLGASLLGIPKENIVAIEDTATGTTSAKEAGLFCIAVSKQPIEVQKLDHADLLLSDLAAVKVAFENWRE